MIDNVREIHPAISVGSGARDATATEKKEKLTGPGNNLYMCRPLVDNTAEAC